MNINKQIEIVGSWGFNNAGDGYSMSRDIYRSEGFTEIWSVQKPDVIQFIKDGTLNHEYKIDWSLFNKEVTA